MDRRVIILGVAIALGAVVVLIGAFMLLSPPSTTTATGRSRPTINAAENVEKPVHTGPRVRVPDDPSLQIVDIPTGETVDDGGLAFSDALCKKTTECGCERRAPKSCATAWGFVSKDQVPDVKCLFDLTCDDLCLLYQHPRPREVACIKAMGKLETEHIMGR